MMLQAIPDVADRELISAVLWFMVGFGAGLVVTRLWKYVLVAVVAAMLAPLVFTLIGFPFLPGPENVLAIVSRALDMLAAFLASNRFSALGFFLGVLLSLVLLAASIKR